ncbi:MAG: PucR family transcriptional regulator [Lachnospiraceae bacterium]|nr:PucR family transcriptional regulator [Lachnospiraceae bacterium]
MLFTSLINEICPGTSVKLLHSDDLYNLSDVAFLDGSQTEYNRETLYFGYARDMVDHKLPPQCILARESSSGSAFVPEDPPSLQAFREHASSLAGTNLALVDRGELFRVFNLAKSLIDASRNQGFYGEMMDCAARSHSIEPIINLAAAKLGNSLVLLDANFKILACSTIFPIDDPLWEENIRLGYCTYEFVSAVQQIDAVKNAARNSDPVVVTCYASPLRKLSSKIFVRGSLVGIVLMLEKETPISPLHFQLLPVISAAARDAVCRYAPYLFSDNTIYEKLLYDLLIGAPPEEIAPQLTGLSFSPHLCALCIRQSRYLGQKHLKEEVAGRLLQCLPNTRFTFHENGIAALVPLGDAPQLTPDMGKALEELAEKEYLRIGVSNLFFQVENFSKRYAQAMRALELSSRLHPEATVCLYSDYAFYDLLWAANDPDLLGLYCHPALAILSRYDHANGTDFYHTLEAYLACGCSVKDTAQKLFIHRNSLNYRLERIRQLTQADLDHSKVRFLLEMSYRIDHFTGRDA